MLNELLESAGRVRAALDHGFKLLLLVPEPEARQDPTLQKTLAALPQAQVQETDFAGADLDALARALYVEPGLWPLTVLTDGTTAFYGHAGYGVGIVPLALELAGEVKKLPPQSDSCGRESTEEIPPGQMESCCPGKRGTVVK